MFGATAAKIRLFHLHGQDTYSAVDAAQFMGSERAAAIAGWRRRRTAGQPRPAVLIATMAALAVLASPGKQIGREIGSGTTHARRPWRQWLRIELGFDGFAVEMPGGMPQQGDHDGKAQEERQR